MINLNETLHRIAGYLIINASFTNSLGLYYGKMGSAIFFAHYSRYTQKMIYEDCMMNLIDEIYEDIHDKVSIGLEDGLCGIGWGLEYLAFNGFLNGDIAVLLEDIDLHVMEYSPNRLIDRSLSNGLFGIAYYVACHIHSLEQNRTRLDRNYLEDLSLAIHRSAIEEQNILKDMIVSFYDNNRKTDMTIFMNCLIDIIGGNKIVPVFSEENDWKQFPMGLYDGLSGLGLKLMGI